MGQWKRLRWYLLSSVVLAACGDEVPNEPVFGANNDAGASGGSGGGAAASGGTSGAAPDASAGSGGATGGSSGTTGTAGGASGSTGSMGAAGSSGGSAGTVGGGGSGGNAAGGGTSGTSGSGGNDAGGGASGTGGAGGTGGSTSCGASGQPCCASGDSCNANLTCLGGASCSCAKAVAGDYLLRADGVVLHQPGGAQTPVLDVTTAQPFKGFVRVTGGADYGCGARADGSAWCWPTGSSNAVGQLGNGSIGGTVSNHRATQVLIAANTPLSNVSGFADSALGYTTCAFTTDGKLYCWGQLNWVTAGGAGLNSGYAQAITTNGVAPLSNVVHASVTYGGACAVVKGATTNEMWCWGYNATHELAQGNAMNRQYPVKVVGLQNPTIVSSSSSSSNGNHTNCALDGGQLRCWGWNSYGSGGVASGSITVPTVVKLQDGTTPFEGVTDIAGGVHTFCALVSNGTIWCWGYRNGTVPYPTNLGISNVIGLGSPDYPRYLTSDGKYHIATTILNPTCSP